MYSKNSLVSILVKCKNLKQNTKKKQKNKKRQQQSNEPREKPKKHRNEESKKRQICQVRKSKNFRELKRQSRKNSKVMNTTKRKILIELSNYIRQQ